MQDKRVRRSYVLSLHDYKSEYSTEIDSSNVMAKQCFIFK